MKCGDVRTFLSQLSGFQPVQMQVPQADLEYLSNNGYLSIMPKEQYDSISAEVATLNQINTEMQNETVEERSAEAALAEGEQRTHSIMFHFESGEKKQAEPDNLERERTTIQRDQIDISLKEAKITELIQKKSMIDRLVPFEGEYVSLTGLGVILFKDLNVRNYRVSDTEFSNYVEESRGTATELHSIAERANWYVSSLSIEHVQADTSQLWGVAIGLAKLQENQYQILDRFLAALGTLNHLDSPIDNKMMAAEIMTSFRSNPAQQISTDNSDIQDLSKSLMSIEHDVRHHGHVPKEQSPGVAATILSGR